MSAQDFDPIRDKKLKLSDIVIIRQSPRRGRPDEIEDGVLQYLGKTYYFKFSHEFDEGNTYMVYDASSNLIAYFVIKMGDAAEEQAAEEAESDSPSIDPAPDTGR